LHGTGDQFGGGIDARRFGEDVEVEPFVTEIAEARGQRDRQVHDLRRATRHQRQLLRVGMRRPAQDRASGRG
jgi:hypothetical protein